MILTCRQGREQLLPTIFQILAFSQQSHQHLGIDVGDGGVDVETNLWLWFCCKVRVSVGNKAGKLSRHLRSYGCHIGTTAAFQTSQLELIWGCSLDFCSLSVRLRTLAGVFLLKTN